MGLDYSINLYFPARNVVAALQAYAKLSLENQTTLVRLRGTELRVPYSSDFKYDPVDLLSPGSSIKLETSALFPIDEAIRQGAYAHRPRTVGGTEHAEIGYIYLRIRLGCIYSEFSFTAATSGMSRVFEASDAIRGAFRDLLSNAGGVAGWLDKEDHQYYSLLDPNQTLPLEATITYSDDGIDPISPDWMALNLCRSVAVSLPAIESLINCRTSDTVGIANAIHSTRSLEALPILADALQDAGCDNADILDHCRLGIPHAAECFVTEFLRHAR